MRHGKLSLFTLLVTALSAIGCQSSPATTSTRYDNVRFMDVWGTYTHCLLAEDTQAALVDSTKLRDVSRTQSLRSPIESFLPTKLMNMVAQPASRLAVDIQAMSASCSLHAGNLALSAGDPDLAKNQFREVLANHSASDYSYYASQAREWLSYLDRTLQAALR